MTKEEIIKNIKKLFLTKKQIIKINGMYAPRYKKWYHLRWRYIGTMHSFTKPYVTYVNIEDAMNRLNEWLGDKILYTNE